MRPAVLLALVVTPCAFGQQDNKESPKPTPEIQALIAAAQKLPSGQVLSGLEEAANEAEERGDRPGRLAALGEAGEKALSFGRPKDAIRLWEECLPIVRDPGNRSAEADVLSHLGEAYSTLGEDLKALDYYRRCLAMRRELADRAGEASALNNVGRAWAMLGKAQKGLGLLEQAFDIEHQIGDKGDEPATLLNMGSALGDLGQTQEAIDRYSKSLVISAEIGDLKDKATALIDRSALYAAGGETKKALEGYAQALSIARTTGDQDTEGWTLKFIGDLHSDLGEAHQSLDFDEEALKIARMIGDRRLEAETLIGLGLANRILGQSQKALDVDRQALAITQETGNLGAEATVLSNIGRLYDTLGQAQRALDYYTRALPLEGQIGEPRLQAVTLNNMGLAEANLGHIPKALDRYFGALPIRRKVGDRAGEARTLQNIGLAYSLEGQEQNALKYFDQALPIEREVGSKQTIAATLDNIGMSYDRLGQPGRAFAFYHQALAICRETGDRTGEAGALHLIGSSYISLGEDSKAIDFMQRALRLIHGIGDSWDERGILSDIGDAYLDGNRPREAISYLLRALPMEHAEGDRAGEGITLSNLGVCYGMVGQRQLAQDYLLKALPIEASAADRRSVALTTIDLAAQNLDPARLNAAILLLKESLSEYEALRAETSTLSLDLQKTYRDKASNAYRTLASVLIQSGRVLEARKVLNLLKSTERFLFARKSSSDVDGRGITYVAGEASSHLEWERLERKSLEADAELQRVEAAKQAALRHGAAFSEDRRLRTAELQSNSAQHAMSAFVDRLSRMGKGQSRGFLRYEQKLWGEYRRNVNAPLGALETRAHVRVATVSCLSWKKTTSFQIARAGLRPLTISEKVSDLELGRATRDLRIALQKPNLDPRVPGKRLFDLVLSQPIRKLRASGIHHVMWALDGPLRTIPLAAVWDGKHYLAETESYTVYSPLDIEKLNRPRAKGIRVAAFGRSAGATIGDSTFLPLTSVKAELAAIRVAVPTDAKLDGGFTVKALISRLSNSEFNVAHIASHFDLESDYENSALLTGEGLLSLQEILGKDSPLKKPWSHLDLVVLSACDTASSVKDTPDPGADDENFASVVLGMGAGSVMASMWSVSDASTALLMGRFYKNWKRGMSKEEALRQAQISMIRSSRSPSDSVSRSKDRSAPSITAGRYSHPYYWAPFVIYGNWR